MQSPSWLPSLVWTDYRLALLFTVLMPLILLLWAFIAKAETMQSLLVIYWRVSSLLAITVYLLIGALPVGFIAGWVARVLIPVSLWFWADLNEEIKEQPSSRLKLSFVSWRWAVSLYCGLGAIAQIPVLRCALTGTDALLQEPFCRIWLDPPWAFRAMFHPTTKPFFLGFLALVGLAIYVIYLGYFVVVRLGRQGRSATGQ
ncbi:DUF3177 family protein [Stenomitos frigidus]|uniref:DUF3177 domain-containing protein n=1 Tax=Stenomitos frigidus ULC18 TaxID=2107698 RepID=A0A2T1ECL3_9CYAN|nr:DUF3177 family protein [Stenomitos frigidus]PSB30448.1 DUF3177 domain-containing protein [Stenomitos frigidus ULC18]